MSGLRMFDFLKNSAVNPSGLGDLLEPNALTASQISFSVNGASNEQLCSTMTGLN